MSTESEQVAMLHSPPWTSPPVDRHNQPTGTYGHRQGWKKIKTSPWENLWAEFQNCPRTLPESALDRLCPGRRGWPTPAALFPVMHTNKLTSRNMWHSGISIYWEVSDQEMIHFSSSQDVKNKKKSGTYSPVILKYVVFIPFLETYSAKWCKWGVFVYICTLVSTFFQSICWAGLISCLDITRYETRPDKKPTHCIF